MSLKDVAQASLWLERIEEENGSFLHDYADIAYRSLIGDFNGVLAKAEQAVKSESCPFTLYYYISLALFRMGRYKEADVLANEMKMHTDMPNLNRVAKYIEKALEKA